MNEGSMPVIGQCCAGGIVSARCLRPGSEHSGYAEYAHGQIGNPATSATKAGDATVPANG